MTAFTGRQTVEIGFKYLLVIKGQRIRSHDLGALADKLITICHIDLQKEEYSYLQDVKEFCVNYTEYTEGGNPEYFRYPEYQNGDFGGVHLDIPWLCYNFALILLKQQHFLDQIT